jgi:hypothetical protein
MYIHTYVYVCVCSNYVNNNKDKKMLYKGFHNTSLHNTSQKVKYLKCVRTNSVEEIFTVLYYYYYYYYYYYLAGCTMFLHLPAPISPVASVIPVFFH